MSDKELEEHIKKVEPNFSSHLEKGTIEMSNEFYNLLEERMARLINQNQSLKKQLEEYIKSNMKLEEELSNKRKEYQDTYKDVRIEIKEYKTQQKEFIKWLEDYLNLFDYRDIQEQAGYDMLEEILQQYKEIVGDNK